LLIETRFPGGGWFVGVTVNLALALVTPTWVGNVSDSHRVIAGVTWLDIRDYSRFVFESGISDPPNRHSYVSGGVPVASTLKIAVPPTGTV
jgi:hypothetical protein